MSAVHLSAQSSIGYRAENRALKQVLNDLEKQYSIYFSFNPDEIKNEQVSFISAKTDVEGILGEALKSTPLAFEKVEEKFYVVKKASSKFLHLKITDAETDDPLPYATIRLKNSTLGQVADEKGELRLVISKPKEAILEISFLGFETYALAVNSLTNLALSHIALTPRPLSLNDFEVREYINIGIASDPKANSFKILPQEMEILPGLSERDVLLSAQIISGVNSNDESAAGINIRGSSRDNTLLYWNEIPVYHTAHYFGNISSFIPSSIGSVDIFKNFIPVRYGGASAGLISLYSRNEINGQKQVEASVNMTHADLFTKLPFLKEKGSFMLAVRRSYNDALPTWTFNSYGKKLFSSEIRDKDGVLEETQSSKDLSFSDINFQWKYQPSGRSLFSTSFLHGRSRFAYNQRDPRERMNVEQNHNLKSTAGSISWKYRATDNYSIHSNLSYSYYSMAYSLNNIRKPNDPNDDDLRSRSNSLENLELRLTNQWQISSQHVLEYGYQLNHFDIKNSIVERNVFEQDAQENIDSKGFVNAFFADYKFNPNRKWELVASGRLSHIGTLGKSYFSPQVKLNYNASPFLIVKSSFGVYHQYLSTLKESKFTLSNAVEQHWLLADNQQSVPVIQNIQNTLGFIWNRNSWLVDFDFFQKEIQGLLARNMGFQLRKQDNFDQGEESIVGFDLTVRKRWQYLRTWFSYNYQNSEVTFDDIFDQSFPSTLNIAHQLRLSSTYNLGNWEFSLGYLFKTGTPYTPIEGVRLVRPGENGGPENGEDFYSIEYASPNSSRLPEYHRIDTSVWHRFASKKGKTKGEVGVSFINLLNRKNIYNRSFFVDQNRRGQVEILEETKFFLEFTPNLSVRVWF